MGGLSGHIKHVFEDPTATVGWVFETLFAVANGRVELYEKVDGMGFAFTWGARGPRCARNAGDVARGGMDAVALATKFEGRGAVRDAFVGAFDALSAATASSRDVFCDGRVWASFEIVDPACKNVIEYDRRRIVVHRFCWSCVAPDGKLEQLELARQRSSYDELCDAICRESAVDASRDAWKLSASRAMTVAPGSAERAKRALAIAKEEMFPLFISFEPVFVATARAIGGDPDAAMRAAGCPKNDITRRVSRNALAAAIVSTRLIAADRRIALALFATLVMPEHSPIARDADDQAKAIVAAVTALASESRDPSLRRDADAVERLAKIMTLPVIEGIVFETKRGVRKLTGWFGPANQVLGHGRYGGRRSL